MSTRRKPKLKPQPANGYPVALCAADGCGRESEYIDGTGNVWDFDVPLCDNDYAKRPPAPMRKPEPVKEEDTSDYSWEVTVDRDDEDPTLYHFTAKPKSHKLFR